MLLLLPRLPGYVVSRLNGSHDRQLARLIGPLQIVLTSLWGARGTYTTRRRRGLGPDRAASYPLLAVRKPAPMVAGDRRCFPFAPPWAEEDHLMISREKNKLIKNRSLFLMYLHHFSSKMWESFCTINKCVRNILFLVSNNFCNRLHNFQFYISFI